jgi:hypothetical protein
MSLKDDAKRLIETKVLPEANRKLPSDSVVEYQVVEEKPSLLTRAGVRDSEVLYIAPVNTDTGDMVHQPSLLNDLGVTIHTGDFQDHLLSAFRSVSQNQPGDLFNVVAGHTYAKVKVNPIISGNV